MLSRSACLAVVAAALSAPRFSSATVLSGPVTNPANNHRYYLLSQDTWTESESEATTLGGHLTTVNDNAENTWIFDTFAASTQRNLWIGLNDLQTEGAYAWTSLEPVGFTNWVNNQPDNKSATDQLTQDYTFMLGTLSPFFPGNPGRWDDVNNSDVPSMSGGVFGVVEVVLPEPASLAIVALAGAAASRRRTEIFRAIVLLERRAIGRVHDTFGG